MAKTWHYTLDGVAAQVLDEKTFVEHCLKGKVTDAAMVWTAGMPAWQPYGELRAIEEANAEAAARKAAEKQAEAEAEAKVKRYTCVKCEKDWPVSLMVQSKARWLCRLCYGREEAAAREAAERKNNRKSNWWPDTRVIVYFTAGLVAFCVAAVFAYQYLKATWNALPVQPAESWANLPSEQWPQIALPGEVQNRGGLPPLRAANNFLVVDNRFQVLGVAFARMFQEAARAELAAHADPAHPAAPGEVKEVATDIILRRLNASMAGWSMGAGPSQVVFTRIHGEINTYTKTEVFFLESSTVLSKLSKLPAEALKPRIEPFEKDMRIFVISSQVKHPGDKQGVLFGKLHGTLDAKRTLDLEMDSPIDPGALVGAPVIDGNGHLAGVVNGSFDSPDKSGQIKTLSAESLVSFSGPLGVDANTTDPHKAKPSPAASPSPSAGKPTPGR